MKNRSISVLIVEDDDSDFVLTRRLLGAAKDRKFELRRATSLKEGIAALADAPAVVLLDLTLPDSFGWKTFSSFLEAAPDTPIILLTGVEDEALGVRAVTSGAEDYLIKGRVDTQLLARAIVYAIERKRVNDHLRHLAEELRRRNEEMAADLQLACEVQHALMPRQCPVIPPVGDKHQVSLRFSHLYRPCRIIGGDFFSYFSLSDHSAGALICDVMGHGMRSALVTAILQGLVERLRATAHDPARLLTEMNQALVDLLRQPRHLVFASAAYGVVDIAAMRVSVALAGHPPPLLIRSSLRPAGIMPLNGGLNGPALGIDRNYHYVAREWNLTPGDKVVFFTDGLYELRNAAGQEYGMQKVSSALADEGCLPIDALLTRTMDNAAAFASGMEIDDDICLLGIELKDRERASYEAGG